MLPLMDACCAWTVIPHNRNSKKVWYFLNFIGNAQIFGKETVLPNRLSYHFSIGSAQKLTTSSKTCSEEMPQIFTDEMDKIKSVRQLNQRLHLFICHIIYLNQWQLIRNKHAEHASLIFSVVRKIIDICEISGKPFTTPLRLHEPNNTPPVGILTFENLVIFNRNVHSENRCV